MEAGLSIRDQDIVDDQVEVAFGDTKIYYDNAEMLGDFATLNIEVAFEMQQYMSHNTGVSI